MSRHLLPQSVAESLKEQLEKEADAVLQEVLTKVETTARKQIAQFVMIALEHGYTAEWHGHELRIAVRFDEALKQKGLDT